jgi:hypothetical protein
LKNFPILGVGGAQNGEKIQPLLMELQLKNRLLSQLEMLLI